MDNYFGCKFIFTIVVMWSLSCGAKTSSETNQFTGLESERTFASALSEMPVGGDESEAIIQTVNNFWKSAQDGNESTIQKYISETPDEFWTEESEGNTRIVPDQNRNAASGELYVAGQGIKGSSSEKETEFALLEYFTKQIHKARPELLKARIIRSNESEAIVKIDYVKPEDKVKGGWLSKDLLLFKSTNGWRIFMLTDPLTLEGYNPNFAKPN